MTPKNSQTPSFDLKIDSLSFNGGRGVGRHEGLVVFVADTAPGDLVRVRPTRKKSKFWEAELVEVLKPSNQRRLPLCPVADRCGGCVWQHVSYEEQVRQKEKILEQSLRSLRKFGEWKTETFLAAPEEFYYRSRIQLQVRGKRYGFFAKRSHDLIETDTCKIAARPIDKTLRDLKIIEETDRLELTLDDAGELYKLWGKRPNDARVFSQINRAQNEKLRETVRDWVSGEPDWLYDLYCGSGNLTLPLAEKFGAPKLTGVELSAGAIALAEERTPEIRWRSGAVDKALKKLSTPKGNGAVILDPPRVGCEPEAASAIAGLGAKQILYVSCNPMTFARDVQPWLAEGRYRLERVQGFDMFPQTEHVEMIASLCAAT